MDLAARVQTKGSTVCNLSRWTNLLPGSLFLLMGRKGQWFSQRPGSHGNLDASGSTSCGLLMADSIGGCAYNVLFVAYEVTTIVDAVGKTLMESWRLVLGFPLVTWSISTSFWRCSPNFHSLCRSNPFCIHAVWTIIVHVLSGVGFPRVYASHGHHLWSTELHARWHYDKLTSWESTFSLSTVVNNCLIDFTSKLVLRVTLLERISWYTVIFTLNFP